jgi:hypothetical protein
MDIQSSSRTACPYSASLSTNGASRLYTSAEVHRLREEAEVLTSVLNWVDGFLARPNSQLGRSGKVCPFVPEALYRGSLQMTILRASDAVKNDPAEMEKVVMSLLDRFLEGEGADAGANIYRSMLIIFPDISAEEAPFLIDATQRKLKAEFVRHGLMLGEFHPLSNQQGLRNPEFRPLRSPIPLLAIRHMVESDIDFLNRPHDPPSQRIQFLSAYLQTVGPTLSPTNRAKVTMSLQKATDELSSICS